MNGQGIIHDEPLMGVTLPEQNLGKQGFHVDSSHYLGSAANGAGKQISSQCFYLLGWGGVGNTKCGDMVVITPKEDLCNFSLGRRTDARLHADPGLRAKWGPKLGTDKRGISRVTCSFRNAVSYNFDAGGQTAYPTVCYSFLEDVRVNEEGGMARLQAIVRGLLTDEEKGKDPFWLNSARDLLGGAFGHQLTAEPDTSLHTIPAAIDRLMGIDPQTGQAKPQLQENYFREWCFNPCLGGYIASQGAEALAMKPETLSSIVKMVGNATRWIMADKRIRKMLSGPSAFSLWDFGRSDELTRTLYVTPRRGDAYSQRLLTMLLELAVLIWQDRKWKPTRKIGLMVDELAQIAQPEQLELIKRSLNILRDVRVSLILYVQSIAQLIAKMNPADVEAMLSAVTWQAFGVNDMTTAEMICKRLGQTLYRTGHGHAIGDVASVDAILKELDPSSALEYVIPYTGQPVRLERYGYREFPRTREGLRLKGLPYDGMYDENLPAYDPTRRRTF